jgi:glyceraldehyde 3-phosphate dehydrogenase
VNWGSHGVDVLLECTGAYTTKAKAQALLDAGRPPRADLRPGR